MIIMSQLSDAQEQINFDVVAANRSINFSKYLLLKFPDTNVEISRETLEQEYSNFLNQ